MSKSQNTKNEQQKDLCITSEQLTEQYLNGNLHDGDEYYIQDKDGEISTICLYNTTMHWHSFKVKKLKVLAPVPSYDELKESYNCMLENEVLRLKNARLKELLKECFEYIDWTDGTGSPISQQKLLDKIDEVLK